MVAPDEDWEKEMKVLFIGEQGLDLGGLSREYFSLFFASKHMLIYFQLVVHHYTKEYHCIGRQYAKLWFSFPEN